VKDDELRALLASLDELHRHERAPEWARIAELARDVGYLRRRFASNETAWSGAYLADRIAAQVERLDVIARPSAAQLIAWTYPGDDETIEAALDQVDCDRARIRSLLGWKADR
jgi:hypothetical protein